MIEDWQPSVTSATKPRYSVVVPVFNEGANIAAFCAAARDQLPPDYELLICYDFDADDTIPALEALPAEAKPANIRLVRNRLGRGVRWAIDAGMRAAVSDIVLVTMADLSDDFSNVEPMLQKAEAGATVVCASRYMPGGQQIGGPKFKKFLSRTAGLTLKWFAGMPTHDPTNSFKVYRRDFLQKTAIESEAGFALGIELTVKAHIAGLKVEEVPATWRDRTAGQSRFKLFKWIPMYLRWYLLAMRKSWIGRAIWFTFLTLAFLFTWTAFVPPADGKFPEGDLDGSWSMVLHWTHTHHVDYGKDIVFTFGPWGYILQGYTPTTYTSLFLSWSLIAAAFFAGAVKLSRRFSESAIVRGIWLLVITALAGIGVDQIRDVRLFAPTCIFFLLYAFLDDLGLSITTVLLMAATALTSQVKFSTTLMTVTALVIISVDQIRRRKIPWAFGVYLLSYISLWAIAGQSFSTLPAYLKNSTAVAGGYSQGESISQPTEATDVTWFIICSLPMLGVAAFAAWQSSKDRLRLLAPMLGLSMLTFVVFKAGYVRHDEHGMEGTASLAMIGLLVLAAVWRKMEEPGWKIAAFVGAIAPLILTWQSFYVFKRGTLPGQMADTLVQVPSRLHAASKWASGKNDFNQIWEDRLAFIRKAYPMPAIDGTVDIYPWYQNIAIAYGMNYKPRPVFQSYLAYSPSLEKLNAESLAGPNAPDNILWTFGCIDMDYPSLEDGLAWPQILTHYDLRSIDTPLYWYTKSNEKRDFSLEPLGDSETATMGKPISVPDSDEPVWANITVHPTIVGKVASFLLKPPLLMMIAHTAGGDNTFRLLPDNAAAGFLLSPMVVDPMIFALLQSPDWNMRLAGEKVTSISIQAYGDKTTSAYGEQYDVSFHKLVFPHRDISNAAGMGDYLHFQDFARQIRILKSDGKPQIVPVDSHHRILVAPAMTILMVQVKPDTTHVHIKFGMLNQTQLGLPADKPYTDGVTFRLSIPQTDATGRTIAQAIWSRTIDPDHNPGDRGQQEDDVPLTQPGLPFPQLLVLETLPGPKHVNSISYWSGVDFH